MKVKEINFTDFRSNGIRALSGRDKGEQVREALKLKELDSDNNTSIVFIVPPDIIQINSSFFLGLIGDSVRTLGQLAFSSKYSLRGPTRIMANFKEAQDRAQLERNLGI